MYEIIMETGVEIVAALLLTLIGVLGTWLTAKISKQKELVNIATATGEVVNAASSKALYAVRRSPPATREIWSMALSSTERFIFPSPL